MAEDQNFKKKLESIDSDFNQLQKDFSEGEIVFDDDNEPTVSIKKISEIRFDNLDNEYSNVNAQEEDDDDNHLGNNEIIDNEDDEDEDFDDIVVINSNRKFFLVGAFVILVILVCVVYALLNAPDRLYGSSYEKGVQLMNDGQYYEAIEQFNKAGSYKNSIELTRDCRYLYAIQLMEKNRYKEARDIFAVLITYKDSQDYYNESTYLYAKELIDSGEYFKALELLSEIPDYKDVKTILSNDLFTSGLELLKQEKYDKAYQYFKSAANVKNRDLCIAICEIYLWEESDEDIDEDKLATNFTLCKQSDWDIAQAALSNPVFTVLKFKGKWVDEDESYYFNFSDKFEFNIPITGANENTKFKFKNDTILRCDNYNQKEDKRVWTACFKISEFEPATALAPSSVKIESLENKKVYKMTRKS